MNLKPFLGRIFAIGRGLSDWVACRLLHFSMSVIVIQRMAAGAKRQEISHSINRGIVLALALVFAVIGRTDGAIITANSVSQPDVAAAVSSAKDGDTVTIPKGEAIWSSQLSINEKAITIQGAGSDKTIIIDEIVNRTTPLINITFTKTTGMFRLTGIQLKGGTVNTGVNISGIISVHGSNNVSGNSRWRIDNCFFNQPYAKLTIYAWSGLIDNCVFDLPNSVAGGITFDGRIPNSSNHGHRSWATPVAWGTVDAGVYVESCTFTNLGRAMTDGYTGARYVIRYNTINNATVQNHGTESAGVFRGTRSMEVYNNTFNNTTTQSGFAVFFRSGTGVVFNNSVTGLYPGLVRMEAYRSGDYCYPYGQANGVNAWDKNVPTLFASGTHTGSAGTSVLTASAAWTTNQWAGYHVINTTANLAGMISSSAGNTITCYGPTFPASKIQWTPGDTFEIRKVDKALDQPGAGKGDLLGGTGNGPPTPVGWPNQADEPIYYWNNTGNTSVASGDYFIKSGRDYVNQPKPGYKPLTYPHPFITGQAPPPAAPKNLKVVPSGK